jgi:hypothetical protein
MFRQGKQHGQTTLTPAFGGDLNAEKRSRGDGDTTCGNATKGEAALKPAGSSAELSALPNSPLSRHIPPGSGGSGSFPARFLGNRP